MAIFCSHIEKLVTRRKNKVGNPKCSFSFYILLTYNKVRNAIDEADMRETFAPV
jgi:hypothetical protein